MTLPGERYGDMVFQFKIPARDNLIASANRLLRFEFPAHRDHQVYERLIKTNTISAGLSKKTLETLPFAFLETIYGTLWREFLAVSEPAAPEDALLSLLLLAEETSEFDPSQMVLGDIRVLGQQEPGVMHSYYYTGPLSTEQMRHLLAAHQYRTDLLEGPFAESFPDLAYLACRRLSRPLPWSALLDSLEPPEAERYPRLARLRLIRDLLRTQIWADWTINAGNLEKLLNAMRTLLQGSDMEAIATQSGLPYPVRELLIVEGETEKLLLPLFGAAMGLNFNALGIELWPAGGKNSVTALYQGNAQVLRVPICVVLDSDAEAIAEELEPQRRPGDYIYSIAEGEFEDTYDMDLLLQAINRTYQPYPEVTATSFKEIAQESHAKGRVQALRAVWQSYGLGSLDKVDFAHRYAEAFKKAKRQPPVAIRRLLETILKLRADAARQKP